MLKRTSYIISGKLLFNFVQSEGMRILFIFLFCLFIRVQIKFVFNSFKNGQTNKF